jgi:hypothetical protein
MCVPKKEFTMTKAFTRCAAFLLAFAFLQPLTPLPAQEKPTVTTKEGADSLDNFAGTWEGKCRDGATFVVVILKVNGTNLDGTVSIGNMNGDHAGACVSVSAPPVPEHAQKITEAIVKQNILSFNGAKRPNGGFARFELKRIDLNNAQLKLLETPVEEHPWPLVNVQKSK